MTKKRFTSDLCHNNTEYWPISDVCLHKQASVVRICIKDTTVYSKPTDYEAVGYNKISKHICNISCYSAILFIGFVVALFLFLFLFCHWRLVWFGIALTLQESSRHTCISWSQANARRRWMRDPPRTSEKSRDFLSSPSPPWLMRRPGCDQPRPAASARALLSRQK